MKKNIDVHAYGEFEGEPNCVHILGFDREGSDLSSFSMKPKSARKLALAILRAADAAKKGNHHEVITVKDNE